LRDLITHDRYLTIEITGPEIELAVLKADLIKEKNNR
jgi:hypothetical protein